MKINDLSIVKEEAEKAVKTESDIVADALSHKLSPADLNRIVNRMIKEYDLQVSVNETGGVYFSW